MEQGRETRNAPDYLVVIPMINESGYTSIWVDLQVLGRFLLASEEIKILCIVFESEFV